MTVRHRGRHIFDQIGANQFIGFPMEFKGDVYYVDSTNGNNNNSGESWAKAFATVAKALTIAGDWDAVILAGGDYEEDGLIITQRGLKLIGIGNNGVTRTTPLFIGDSATILTVRAHDVEICNLGFVQTYAAPCIYVADAAAIWRVDIHDCYFDGYNTCTYGIQLGAASGLGEAVGAHVQRCKVISMATACIYNNSENVVVEDCLLRVETGTKGIVDHPNGGDRPDRWYLNNKFITVDNSGAYGIYFDNTPTAGLVCYCDNKFTYFADKGHCATLRAGYMGGGNYDDNALLAA
jgi:hypothetical protein